jgi:ribonucleoside-diphosphate reductase alpha subunit
MKVIKRNGKTEDVSFDKVLKRIQLLCSDLSIDPAVLAQKVCMRIYDNITTKELDEFAASLSSSMILENIDYDTLSTRLLISNIHKNTSNDYNYVLNEMKSYLDARYYKYCVDNIDYINSLFDYEKDYKFDIFGYKTLERSYLYKTNGKVIERPQHLLMRVAIGIHLNDIETNKLTDEEIKNSIKETYEMLCNKLYTHATPTLFNCGTIRPQLSSCFLIQMEDDSIDGIYNTLKECALISKEAGGIGLTSHNVRGKNTKIRGTNGISNGLVPMLKVFNETAQYVDQGGSKRRGSFAIYLEPWHMDIEDFLDLKKARGTEQLRARDLFYALWIPDLFMKRVKNNEVWSLMCPDECYNLQTTHGMAFEELYIRYEQQGKFKRQIHAQDLWKKILSSCIETGGPYLLFKDHCNTKSNHSHLGTIQSSNLCAEIIQYTSKEETAVCNLASICLPNYINTQGKFDYHLLRKVVHKIVENLSRVIDVNLYPTPKCKLSNLKHRPIGIGVQGLSDLFQELKMSWEETETKLFHKKLFEYLYYCALEKSCLMAQKYGTYSSYENSPLYHGKLQFDLWGVKPTNVDGLCNWEQLRKDIKKYGVYHSLLIALMPTASTSQIMGFSESMEPQTSNIFVRRTDSGEFKLLNKKLVRSLMKYNLWNNETKDTIIVNDGSVQWMDNFPEKHLFKTIWEFKHRLMIDYSADRGSYIDQSQSFNVYMEEPTISKLSSAYLYSWEKGLKTCQYYLRIRPKAKAISFTIDPNIEKKKRKKKDNNENNNEIPFDKQIGLNSPINFGMISRDQSMKEDSKEDSREDSKEDSKEDSRQDSKEDSRQDSKEDSRQDSRQDINSNYEEFVCRRDNPDCLSCGS